MLGAARGEQAAEVGDLNVGAVLLVLRDRDRVGGFGDLLLLDGQVGLGEVEVLVGLKYRVGLRGPLLERVQEFGLELLG